MKCKTGRATHGCDEIHDYLLARPLPAAECARLLHVRPGHASGFDALPRLVDVV